MNFFHLAMLLLGLGIGVILAVKAGVFVARPFKRGRYRGFGLRAFLLGAVFSMFFGAASFFSALLGPATPNAATWLLVNILAFIFCVVGWLNIALTDL